MCPSLSGNWIVYQHGSHAFQSHQMFGFFFKSLSICATSPLNLAIENRDDKNKSLVFNFQLSKLATCFTCILSRLPHQSGSSVRRISYQFKLQKRDRKLLKYFILKTKLLSGPSLIIFILSSTFLSFIIVQVVKKASYHLSYQ